MRNGQPDIRRVSMPFRVVLIAALGAVASIGARSAHAAAPELRGTWLTTTANTAIATPANTTATMTSLRNIGLNTTYVEVWKEGYTEFPSTTMQNLIGVAMKINPSPGVAVQTRDLLSETLIQSHRNGMACIPWFEYGFAAKYGNPSTVTNDLSKYMATRGWLLKDSAGAYTNASNGFCWMNPLVPEVRNLMKGVIVEAALKYDLDGVQMDDRLAWPVQFGYDAYTASAYLAETGRALPASYSDSNFTAWRAGKVTAFATELNAAVRAARSDIIISTSPAVFPWSYDNYCADVNTWRQNGLFDEIIPQVYRSNISDFNRDWDGPGNITNQGQVQYMGNRRADFAAGISINTGGVIPWADAQAMVNLVRATSPAVAGHVWWYSSGVLSTYPTQLTAYYNVAGTGQAPRTDRPANWRPLPTVATHVGTSSIWNVTVPSDGRYRIIKRVGSTWTEILSTVYGDGALSIDIAGADAIELLVDRRPFLVGDANLSGAVNFDDLLILAQNYEQTPKLWAQGDFSLDGTVDFDDLLLLAQNYNAGANQMLMSDFQYALSIVPEPTSMLVLLPAAMLHRCRRVAGDKNQSSPSVTGSGTSDCANDHCFPKPSSSVRDSTKPGVI